MDAPHFPHSITIPLTEEEHQLLAKLVDPTGLPAEMVLRVEICRFIAAHIKYIKEG